MAKGEKRDWLILSLKWSLKGELLKWWASAGAGYTSSLMRAGRFTEAEAKGEQASCPEHSLAVLVDWVSGYSDPELVLRSDSLVFARLRELAGKGGDG